MNEHLSGGNMRLTIIVASLASFALSGVAAHAKAISAGEALTVQEEPHKTGNTAFPPAPDEAKLRADVPLGKAAVIGDKGYFLSEGHLYWTRLGSGASNVVRVHCTFLYDLYAQAADVRFKQIVAFREALFLLDDSGTLMVRSPRRPDRFVALEVGARNTVASARHLFVLTNEGRVKVYAGNKNEKADKRGYEHATKSSQGFHDTNLKGVTRLRLSDESKVLATFQDGRESNVYDVLEI